MVLCLICAALAAFFGFGMLVEIYEERDFPKYTAPRFLLFAAGALVFFFISF